MKNALIYLKEIQKKTFSKFGYKVVKLPCSGLKEKDLLSNPLDSLVLRQSGEYFSFECPVELCRQENGFGLGVNQWHPFVATLKEYAAGNSRGYEGSVLQKFYDSWNPQNAADALAGFDQAPESFCDFPPYGYFLVPWRPSKSLNVLRKQIDKWSEGDNKEHGKSDLDWRKDGFKYYGPVSKRLGEFEFNRLVSVYEKIKKNGYQRECGDIGVIIVRHDKNYVFLLKGGGVHRAAAMAALGYKTFPAQYKLKQYVLDTKDANYWPQVKSQLWHLDEAMSYVEYLFSFDSRAWAEEHKLSRSNTSV